ncbi:MAG: ATP synthase F1 subunit gamma [Bacteroidales bacterium]
MSTIRELKGRIVSTKSSEKITGAMKMISTAKLRKAEGALKRMMPYREQLMASITHLLGSDGDFPSSFTEKRPVSGFAFVIVGSEEGLCGAFNVYLIKRLELRINEIRKIYGEDLKIVLYPVGRRLTAMIRHIEGVEINKSSYLTSKSDGSVIRNFTDGIVARFLTKDIDEVEIIYPYYKSMASQPINMRTLLPVNAEHLAGGTEDEFQNPYIYEPSRCDIFESLLPIFVRVNMQESIYSGRASEQAARVMSMQAASDNAKKLLDELQLDYNKLRQQGITNELLDIIGGSMQ